MIKNIKRFIKRVNLIKLHTTKIISVIIRSIIVFLSMNIQNNDKVQSNLYLVLVLFRYLSHTSTHSHIPYLLQWAVGWSLLSRSQKRHRPTGSSILGSQLSAKLRRYGNQSISTGLETIAPFSYHRTPNRLQIPQGSYLCTPLIFRPKYKYYRLPSISHRLLSGYKYIVFN